MIKTFGDRDAVHEQTDAEYECTFVEAAVGLPALATAAILTIVATLRDVASGTIINGRNAQNVKGANGGALALDGTFTLQLSGETDNIIVGTADTPTTEKHRLTLEVTYSKISGGTGYLKHEVQFYVLKLKDVPNL
jgi:hypothetical protein